MSVVLVHCDAHRSLIKVCKAHGVPCEHPAPERHQGNAAIERQIGVALAGLRALLATAGGPNCVWPFAGHTFAVNDTCARRAGAYSARQASGYEDDFRTFVWGQLVFYKPAPTIIKMAKTDHPLRAGVFLDYYMWPDGRFSGQYVIADLSDFVGKSLHHRAGPKEFKLSLHHTEVVCDPVGSADAVFPILENI